MNLTLYEIEGCPYCAKVRKKLQVLGLQAEFITVAPWRTDEQRQILAEKSGIGTVPVLKVADENGERFIGESDAIIQWLEEHTQ